MSLVQTERANLTEGDVATAAGYVAHEDRLMAKGLKAHAEYYANLLEQLATELGVAADELRIAAVSAIAIST